VLIINPIFSDNSKHLCFLSQKFLYRCETWVETGDKHSIFLVQFDNVAKIRKMMFLSKFKIRIIASEPMIRKMGFAVVS